MKIDESICEEIYKADDIQKLWIPASLLLFLTTQPLVLITGAKEQHVLFHNLVLSTSTISFFQLKKSPFIICFLAAATSHI